MVTKVKLKTEISAKNRVEKDKAISQLERFYTVSEQNEYFYVTLIDLLEKIISHKGSFILRPSNKVSFDLIVDRSIRNKIDINEYKNNYNLVKEFNVYYGQNVSMPKDANQIKEEQKAIDTIVSFTRAEKKPVYSGKYSNFVSKVISDHNLDKATDIQIKNLGRTRTEAITQYFKELLIDGMTPTIRKSQLVNAISNINIKTSHKSNTKDINIYIKGKNKSNHLIIDCESLFVAEEIRTESYIEPKVKSFIEFFNLDSKLFTNTFQQDTILGGDVVSTNIDMPLISMDFIVNGLICEGYEYFDLSKSGIQHQIIDHRYFTKAKNVINATAIYISEFYNPKISIQITTITHHFLIKVTKENSSIRKPNKIHIFWDTKTNVNSPYKFWNQ